jgi:ferredoxin
MDRLRINPIACTGHGVCAELLPEIIELDPWGYPILRSATIPPALVLHARRAAAACPTLALLLERTRGWRPDQHLLAVTAPRADNTSVTGPCADGIADARGGRGRRPAGTRHGHGPRELPADERYLDVGGGSAHHIARSETLLRAPRHQVRTRTGAACHDRAALGGEHRAASCAGRRRWCRLAGGRRWVRAGGVVRAGRGVCGVRVRPRDCPPRYSRGPLGGLVGQSPVDRVHTDLLTRGGVHALAEHAHREQAAAGRRARSNQPGCDAEQYATVHRPRLARGMLTACKGGFKQFIYEKFI